MDNFYALIMAGGGGTRLWPLSRKSRPKQMLPLVEERSMFQMSVERLDIPPERIFIVTGREHVEMLHEDVPEIPIENYIVEPFGRDSGPAAGLGIIHIQQRDPEAVVAILGSDHYIADTVKFNRTLVAAHNLATRGHIVTLGVSPSYPSTGFGYIKRGEQLDVVEGFQCYHSAGFTEKPDGDTAIHFLTTGLYSWNSGMFICKANQVLNEFARQQPAMYAQFEMIAHAIGHAEYDDTLGRVWSTMKKISLDYAVMECADNMVVIPVDMGWSDVGSWSSLGEVLAADLDGNVSQSHGSAHIKIDTKQTLIVSDRMVVTIGIEEIVIVDTDDVLLVCHRDRSQDVRQVVARLKDAGDDTYL
ncbi:MAG: mannose-1-phosphate guanylyltransferase [Anaerolineae bacterium]|nr:mannose-1-phosphate guanylyltransferase [Anaerolineae bacterium]